jgi:hypothetical protein
MSLGVPPDVGKRRRPGAVAILLGRERKAVALRASDLGTPLRHSSEDPLAFVLACTNHDPDGGIMRVGGVTARMR